MNNKKQLVQFKVISKWPSATLFFAITLCLFLYLFSSQSQAQTKKLDLDDLTIKGELHSDDRLLILSRQKNKMKNYVQLRKSYREEILQEINQESPAVEFRAKKNEKEK